METVEKDILRGGQFLVKESKCEDVFTPEDFSEEQIMMKEAVKEFTDRGIPFQNIPANVVEEYGRMDVQITRDLFNSQMADFRMPKNKHLLMIR